MIPVPCAPRPLPFVQPYFERRRSAKPACPGREERTASGSGVCDSAGFGSVPTLVIEGSVGGGGIVYRTGAALIWPGGGLLGGGGGGGGGERGVICCWLSRMRRVYASSPVGSSGISA